MPGEKLSPTQPFPTKPAPYSNLGYHEDDLIDFTPELRAEAMKIAERYTRGPIYTPADAGQPRRQRRAPSSIPAIGGGSNWNGGAFDPETDMLYVPDAQHADVASASAAPIPRSPTGTTPGARHRVIARPARPADHQAAMERRSPPPT